MRFLPLGLDVRGKRCVVVGGGSVGARKVANLSRAGAALIVVSPVVNEDLAAIIQSEGVRWVAEPFRDDHLEEAFVVVAATDNDAVNANIVECAGRRGILVCDASSAERSEVIFGALHNDESGATVAVFTDGRDPSEARRTRDRIAELLLQDSEHEDPLGSG
jgi:siroheme synthase-like protein